MSVIANFRAAPAALPPLNLHSQSHKRGGHVQATDGDGSNSPAQVPVGLRQSLFGSLLNSLEQAIGVPLTGPAAATSGTTTAAAAEGASTAAPAASAATASAQSSIAMLQNYLNNLPHNPRTDGSSAVKFAASNVNVSA